MEIKNIAVIGAGTMGNGIAHTLAQYGFKVQLIDISETSLQKGLDTLSKNLERMVTKEKICAQQALNALQNITPHTDLEKGVSDTQMVIEAATEQLEVKLKIFKQLDALCPQETILASNTSSISITQIAATTQRPDKVIGMHFMNPVPLMKLVEVIKGYNTSAQVVETTMTLTQKLEKKPILVDDYPGFVANRILMPMINEAIETLYNGVAGVQEIDAIMQLGMAHPMGPLQLADFIGLEVCLSILEVLYEGFKNPKYAPCPLLTNMVRAGQLGIKSGAGFYDYSTHKKATTVAARWR